MIETLDAASLDAIVEPALSAAKAPGGAIAVVFGNETIVARAYGYRELETQQPMTVDTVYPIASTSKAMNATLLGMLVDRGQLGWDVPVREYLPRFRLLDAAAGAEVTVRDLVTMRTGLPRHDLVWLENPVSRADLVEMVKYLPLSDGLRQRFQYNNLTATLAGHVAEVVAGSSWEDLVNKNIVAPLQMSSTGFALPASGNVTASYHENSRREPVRCHRSDTRLIAPAGGAVHSTVRDMSRWVAFNLNGGKASGRQLITTQRLQELHFPWMPMGEDPASPSPGASYGLGWAIDTCNGRLRISHGGDLHDVNSCVTLFPEERIGLVSFANIAVPRLAKAINQYVFDRLMCLEPTRPISAAVRDYEDRIETNRLRNTQVRRVQNTVPSHGTEDYVGTFVHPGYGTIEILSVAENLLLKRNNLLLPLEHWHYDSWVAVDNDLFQIHRPHPFDRASRIVFETSADGDIVALHMRPEPAVEAIRFEKKQPEARSRQ